MANIFPRWSNHLPLKVLVCVAVLGAAISAGVAYYFTPKYTRVGYQPVQPVHFQHDIHVNQLGMDCRYCHSQVEVSAHSNIPTAQTCMNCHSQVQKNNPRLAALRTAWETGQPLPWVRVHYAPDYAYFNHAVHVNRGVSCVSCHGNINQMEVVQHAKPHSMGWCLDCHRNPEKAVRPMEHVFNLDWKPQGKDPQKAQNELGAKLVKDWAIRPPQNCQGCHR
jgi:hypothetical protein